MFKLDIKDICMRDIAGVIVSEYSEAYPELSVNKEFIYKNISNEEEKFHRTLTKGLRRFNEVISNTSIGDTIDNEKVFRLYDTFGFPVELTEELAKEHGLNVDIGDFNKRFKVHQENSRLGSDQQFRGGLADNTIETTKLHTATHLLNSALRKFVDPSIQQKGSNITSERLRFDFNLNRKCT